MEFKIAILPGDGVGRDVAAEGIKIMKVVGERFGHRFAFGYGDIGGNSIDKHGTALPEDTLAMCKESDAVLLGAVGGPKWDDPQAKTRPEDGLLAVRKGLGVFANLRPVKVHPSLVDSSPVKAELLQSVDMIIVRELTGGLYFGRPKERWNTSRGRRGVDTMRYTEQEIERILRVGFELARKRRGFLTSVDKANVLATSRLWREMAMEMTLEYSDVTVEHMLVDTASMQLVRNPGRFDVIVTENTFGDILTDEASVLAGSMGMLPSASLAGVPRSGGRRRRTKGLYEPIHGSAPDIAGQGIANPIAMILSVAMLLRYSLALEGEAQAVERAVDGVLTEGHRTTDIASPGERVAGTTEMGDLIAARVFKA